MAMGTKGNRIGDQKGGNNDVKVRKGNTWRDLTVRGVYSMVAEGWRGKGMEGNT